MKQFRSALLCLATAATLAAAPNPDQPVPDRLDLPGALGFAVENNFTIRGARAQVRQAEGSLVTARAGYLPHLGVDAGYTNVSDRARTSAANQNWSATASVQQSLYSGGAVSGSVRAARASRTAAELQLQATINGVLAGVRIDFYNVLRARETIKVREEAITLLEEELKNARNRYEAGAGAQFDVLRAEVALANGRPPLITARNDLRIAIEELRQMLGFTNRATNQPGKIPEFLGRLEYREDSFTLDAALDAARANRPELQAYAQQLTAAEAGVRIARAGYYPTLGASAGWEVFRDPLKPSVSDDRDGWIVGLKSTWAIWDGRSTAGKVHTAKAKAEQARLSMQEQQLSIDVEVRRAFATWQEAVELVTVSNKVVEQAKEALRLSRARFDVGAATQLDVLQAQNALTDAGNNQVQALYSYNVSVTQLRTAMSLPDPDVK
jgi:TolC family type I secretion outer membrane protein